MNILLIGNGFDLAHGLPTLYKNFLDFCIKAKVIFTIIDGRGSNLYYDEYDVIQINGDRAVIGIGNTVTSAIDVHNIERI